jgi:hypothetical protein
MGDGLQNPVTFSSVTKPLQNEPQYLGVLPPARRSSIIDQSSYLPVPSSEYSFCLWGVK